MKKIFISSTCYDLIDLRAELQKFVEGMGLSPSLSDAPDSDFDLDGLKDSITTCLVNVRSSDAMVCVFSRRYGPSLKNCGFEDVSATHREILEAHKHGVPVFLYVRDRLAAELDSWRTAGRQKTFTSKWILDRDPTLFLKALDDLAALDPGAGTTNWYTTFSTVWDLKLALSKQFANASGIARLQKLIEAAQVPTLSVHRTRNTATSKQNVHIANYSHLVAHAVQIDVLDAKTIGDIPPKEIRSGVWIDEATRGVTLTHVLATGDKIEDHYQFSHDNGRLLWRRYLGANVLVLGPTDPDPVF